MKARLVALWFLGIGAAACAPTYEPVCRGSSSEPLAAGELAQPSGMALAGDLVYVASSAAEAPKNAEYDFCGAFITPFDSQTGKPAGAPLVPHRMKDDTREYFRFFAGIVWDEAREVLYVAERETGSVLKVDPKSGRVLGQVATGRSPYSLQLLPNIETVWDKAGEPITRNLLAVGDIGGAGSGGRVFLLDLEHFDRQSRRELKLPGRARPSAFSYAPAQERLYVGLYDGYGVAGIDVRDLKVVLQTEPVAGESSPVVRGVAAAPDAAGEERIFYAAQSPDYGGLWVASPVDGLALNHILLPATPSDVGLSTDYVIVLAPRRLFFLDRDSLALVHSVRLAIDSPARLLVEEALNAVFVTGFAPSTFKRVDIP